MTREGVPFGIVAAGYPQSPLMPVQVAMIQSLVRRLGSVPAPDLLVTDEGHHGAANTWRTIYAAYPEAHVLGVTATPLRLDGKGLDDVFDEMVIGPTVAELIAHGWLSKFAMFAPVKSPDLGGVHTRAGDYAADELAKVMSTGVIITDAVDEYLRRCPGAPAIAFCVDIAHSELVAAAFAARGVRAAHLDGDTPRDRRRALIAALGTGEIQVLTNCGLVSEGLDVPAVTAVLLLRPTKSLALHLQQVGRSLRPMPDKARALILDHAGNSFRFGPPDLAREWSLAGQVEAEASPLRRCECGALVPVSTAICPECGTVLRDLAAERRAREAASRERAERHAGGLIEVSRLQVMSYGECLRWAGGDERRLRLVARARGYKQGWVWYRLQELQEQRP